MSEPAPIAAAEQRAQECAADADFRRYFRGLLRTSLALRRYLRRPADEIGGITLAVFKSALADAFRAGRAPRHGDPACHVCGAALPPENSGLAFCPKCDA